MKTIKRLSVSLSKEDWRKITKLSEEFGESKASIIQQAVRIYFYLHTCSKENLISEHVKAFQAGLDWCHLNVGQDIED